MLVAQTSKQALIEQALQTLDTLDFSMLKMKMQDTEEGLGWSAEHCELVEMDYKRFLALKFAYPDDEIVPNQEIDKFWHYHILDTMAYAADCERVFGYFVHHFPYFGMRGEKDLQDLHLAFTDTNALYMEHFGQQIAGAKSGGKGKCRTACKPQKCK
jgi:hypothetical protein